MSTETEKALVNWESADSDISDDLHHHFGEVDLWDWCDIGEEARRIWNLMFPEQQIEKDSPIDGLLYAIAAQARHGACASIAAALGVDARDVELASAGWYENQNNLPAPVGPDGLMAKITEARQFRKELDEKYSPVRTNGEPDA